MTTGYHGATRIYRSGDSLSPGTVLRRDPATALGDAWQVAEACGGTPFIYKAQHHGQTVTVTGDVFIDGKLAWQAIQRSGTDAGRVSVPLSPSSRSR